MKNHSMRPRFALIDIWQGCKPLAAIALVLLVGVAVSKEVGSLLWPEGMQTASTPASAVPFWLPGWGAFVILVCLLPRNPLVIRLPGLSPAAKAAACCAALGVFWLAAAHPDFVEAAIGPVLMAGLVIAVVVAAMTASMEARRRRAALEPREAAALDGISHRLQPLQPIPMAQLRSAHPHLIAKISSHFDPQGDRTQIWLMRPHPALSNQRPIDVLHLPDGEERVLQAFEAGPNV